jgi:hypothetical protein
VTLRERLSRVPTTTVIRAGTLALAVVAATGTAVELATERHWNSTLQLTPWAALAVLLISHLLLAIRPGRRAVQAARVLAALVLLTSAFGIIEHVMVNFDSGALDAVYTDTWNTLPVAQRLWYSVTKTVGPTPPLAPGVLGQAALLTLLATWRHPSLDR